jgi:hypothetical protein
MSYVTADDMKEHITRLTRRIGDGTFLAEWPRMLAKAEQRMKYGSGDPVSTPRLRLRGMEQTATVTFTAGVATLPSDYLEAKTLTWAGEYPVSPVYRPATDFASAIYESSGYPTIYTIENGSTRVKPAVSGTANLLYYRTLAAATAGQNWIMANAPSLYEGALLYEAYRFLRNEAEAAKAIADYAAAANGLVTADGHAGTSIGHLAPRVPHARIRR